MIVPRLHVATAGAKGLGVFAGEAIAAGRFVIAMQGRTLTSAEWTEDLFAMQIGPDRWLCSEGGLLDDAINHSCDPNVGFLHGDPVLYALRDIQPGEEIAWDYSTSIACPGWKLICCCGAAQCRRTVVSWPELDRATRERLGKIALDFLRDRSCR